MKVPCKNIPVFDSKTRQWSTKSFEDQYELGKFIEEKCFKEPGEYQFESFINEWNKLATLFTNEKEANEEGSYCNYAVGSKEWEDFWDFEELKCRLGVFWKYKDRWYYTTRDYYFFLNFCPITNKEKGFEQTFITIRDSQYHMALYEKIAECFDLHSVILKRRQFLFSYFHAAKSFNFQLFENNNRIKWFASSEAFLDNVHGLWSYYDTYRNHINKYTGWNKDYYGTYPESTQKVKVRYKSDWEWEGNMSTIFAKSLKIDPKGGVGGPSVFNVYEEGGVAPTADITLQFMEPSLISGTKRVGSFCIGGSVGDLEQCAPLKKFILNPDVYGFYAVNTKYYSKDNIPRICGLFIPAQYSMPEATDKFGNSEIDLALHIIEKSKKQGWKKGEMKGNLLIMKDEVAWEKMKSEEYAIKLSQNPTTIEEAFAFRKVMDFDGQKLQRVQDIISIKLKNNELDVKKGLLERSKEGNIRLKQLHEFSSNKPEEIGYPVNPEIKDKRGVVNIYEDYNPNFSYYAGVDSVEADITDTSESLFSIVIYRRAYTEIDTITGKVKMIRGKVVAIWSGRFNSTEETNEHGAFLLEMYKARAACERNKPGFINYCRRNGLSKLIARRNELPFDKDIDVTASENDLFGVYNDSAGKLRAELVRVTKEYLNAEVDLIYFDVREDQDYGKIKKIVRGYDLIPDYWLLEELKKYHKDNNTDRVDAFMLALAFGTAEELSFQKKVEVQSEQKPIENKIFIPKVKSYLNTYRKPRNLLYR